MRQYHSLLIARSFYYKSSDSVTDADKNIALAARPPLLEPPIIEYAASLLYRVFGVFGSEIIMIPIPNMLSMNSDSITGDNQMRLSIVEV